MDEFDKYGFKDAPESRDNLKKNTMVSERIELDSNYSEGNTQTELGAKEKASNKNLLDMKKSTENEEIDIKEDNKPEQKTGIFGNFFGSIGDFFSEIPLLWKKEELVDGFDAHGNPVKRPKNKIPFKNDPNKKDMLFKKVDEEANISVYDNAKKGINYAALFN